MIPSGDFCLYDHVLDTAWALGAVDRDAGYFALARGTADAQAARADEVARHQLPLPRAGADARPARSSSTPRTGPGRCARPPRSGSPTRPVVLGPFSFLQLSKGAQAARWRRSCRSTRSCCASWPTAGATEVQLDEPCLALDRTAPRARRLRRRVRRALAAPIEHLPGDVLRARRPARLRAAGAAELHVDLVRAPGAAARRRCETPGRLSLGVLDGRNVWAADLDLALDRIDAAVAALGSDRVTIAPSCSLLHVPVRGRARDDRSRSGRGWRSRPRS